MSATTKRRQKPSPNGGPVPPVEATLVPPRTLYRLSLDQYHRMTEANVLTVDDKVELLDGLLITKMTRKPPHDDSIARLMRRLARLLPDEWTLRVQSAVSFAGSEPEPDFAVARGSEGTYSRRHPTPRDVELIVEVADSSYLPDKRDKGTRYARARIPQYWIVNVVDRRVEVYTSPKGGRSPRYQERRDYGPEDSVPLVLVGRQLALLPVRELLPD